MGRENGKDRILAEVKWFVLKLTSKKKASSNYDKYYLIFEGSNRE